MTDFVYKRQDSYNWFLLFDDRQQKEIELNKIYDTPSFRHGTDGHNLRIIVSMMAARLNAYEDMIQDYKDKEDRISGLEQDVEELTDENNDLRSELDSKENCDECEDCDELVNQEVNDLEESNKHLAEELEEANDRIKELEMALEQLEELKDEEDA